MGKNGIVRNNTVIDPEKGIDLATAISKYTSGGVMLTDAIAELAKSLTILFQDQMGYSSFTKRHNSCKFDLHRECFYFWGHDPYTGDPVSHIIHEWQTAGDVFTFGDGVTGHTASRTEIRQFAKDLPGFLEKLRDDLMSSAAESEGKADMIACIAEKLRECNLIIFKRQKDRPEPPRLFSDDDFKAPNTGEAVIRLIIPGNVEMQVEQFVEATITAINKIDAEAKFEAQPGRIDQYAVVFWAEFGKAYTHGVDRGSRAQASDGRAAEAVQDEDEVIRKFADAVLLAITALDETPSGTQAERYMKYMEAISANMKYAFRCAFRRGIDQGMQADEIRVAPSPGSSFRGSLLVQASRIDVGKTAVMKCPVCGAYKDLLRLTVAGTVIAYICPDGHSYLFTHDPAHVHEVGAGDRTAAAYLQPIPGSHVMGSIPIKAERVLIRPKDRSDRRCVTCGKPLDHIMITVAGKDRAVIGVCPEGNTYLYLPSDYEDMPTEPEKGKES